MADHNVELSYTGTAFSCEPDPVKIKKGETISFTCAEGPVHVLIQTPGMFSPDEFTAESGDLTAVGEGQFKFCCGARIGGKTVGYPDTKQYGKSGDIGTKTD